MSTTNSAMFTGTLYPNDTTAAANNNNHHHHVSLTPQTSLQNHLNNNNHNKNQTLGNDEYYSTIFEKYRHNNCTTNTTDEHDDGGGGGRFKVRIVVSKANEGVTAKKYHDGLFDLCQSMSVSHNNNDYSTGGGDEGITEDMIQENESLQRLRQCVLDARMANQEDDDCKKSSSTTTTSNNTNGGKDQKQSLLGYQVTIMLCEPHIQNEDIVIPPPSYLDKCDVNFLPVPYPKPPNNNDDAIMYNPTNNKQGIFQTNNNVCNSLQFVAPGPWEKANLNAFQLIALDLKKALVRVEFPMFPEGCREKTFREVYQLNARVSFVCLCVGEVHIGSVCWMCVLLNIHSHYLSLFHLD